MSDQQDTCRAIDVDGETVRVRGAGNPSPEATDAVAAVVRAARDRMEAEELAALDDEISRTYGAIHAPSNLAEILTRHGWAKADQTRQQVAQEIAAAIEAAGDARSKHRNHERPAVSRLGSVRHTSYLAAAKIAREIGRGA